LFYEKYIENINSYDKSIDYPNFDSYNINQEGEYNKTINDIDIKEKIDRINKLIEKEEKNDIDKSLSQWRTRVYNTEKDIDVNKYDLDNYFKENIKDNIEKIDLSIYFDYNYKSKLLYPSFFFNIKKHSVVDMLLFSKTRVNYNSLNLLLGLIRIKTKRYAINLDHYEINLNYFSSKYYDIKIKDVDVDEDNFPKNDYNKFIITKYLRLIFHEFSEKESLNLHNYSLIVDLYEDLDEVSSYYYNSIKNY
jgi:PBP1b-binding outer membrane lipoprotein LpoB